MEKNENELDGSAVDTESRNSRELIDKENDKSGQDDEWSSDGSTQMFLENNY